jgi:hypothetical protein
MINTLEESTAFGRLGFAGRILRGSLWIKQKLWTFIKSVAPSKGSGIAVPQSSDGGYGIDENWIKIQASKATNYIISHSDYGRIVASRRRNYLSLVARLASLEGVRPLFSELPDGVVPLVVPMYFDLPDRHFPALKRIGVPIWRFGEYLDADVDENVCSVSLELSRHILQFPCHQELRNDELEWMIEQIAQTLNPIKRGN